MIFLSFNFYRLLKFIPNQEFSEAFPSFLSFLSSNSFGLSNEHAFFVYRTFFLFNGFPIIKLDSRPILFNEKKKTNLNLKVHNIFGENLDGIKIKGNLELNNKQLFNEFTFNKKSDKNFNAHADLDLAGITELRAYDIRLFVESKEESYQVVIFFEVHLFCF